MIYYTLFLITVNTLMLGYLFLKEFVREDQLNIVLDQLTQDQLKNVEKDISFVRKQINSMVEKKARRKKPGPKPGTVRKLKNSIKDKLDEDTSGINGNSNLMENSAGLNLLLPK